MRLKFKKVTGTQETAPKMVDRESSTTVVYLRKNISEETTTDENGEKHHSYSYDEATMTVPEYEKYLDEVESETHIETMQRLSALEAAQEEADIASEDRTADIMQMLNDMQADSLLEESEVE